MVEPGARGARDRIRDSAIGEFARKGYAGASVRSIAADAGVTPGLIVHHFGTKAALREACDARVIEVLLGEERSTDPAVLAARLADDDDDGVPYVRYLTAMLQAEPERADAVFDRVLAATREMVRAQHEAGMLREGVDVDQAAAVLAVYGLAPLLLPRQLARAFGHERLGAHTLTAAGAAMGQILASGLYAVSPLPPPPA